MAEEEALRLDRLVRDLLQWARPITPTQEVVDLHALAKQVTESIDGRRREKVQVTVTGTPTSAWADPFLLKLAIENLLNNAIRFSPVGGTVSLSVQGTSESASLRIEDQGPGIPTESAERIFEPFFTTSAVGTGLGLAIVQRIVRAHAGQVTMKNREGGGDSCPTKPVPSRDVRRSFQSSCITCCDRKRRCRFLVDKFGYPT
jgi:signal transduction histidine kinase